MKLISYGPAGGERPGVLLDNKQILEIEPALNGTVRTIRQLLEGGREALERLETLIKSRPDPAWVRSAEGVRLGPPVTDPSKIVCLGLNYRSREQNRRERDGGDAHAAAHALRRGHVFLLGNESHTEGHHPREGPV